MDLTSYWVFKDGKVHTQTYSQHLALSLMVKMIGKGHDSYVEIVKGRSPA